MGKVTVTDAHIAGLEVLKKSIQDREKITATTKVLLSFGAREGGFEYIGELRQGIMASKGWTDQGSVYLDAVSADEHPFNHFNAQAGFKLNPVWSNLYLSAIQHCKAMVFVVTKPWVASQWCAGELAWWKANKEKTPIIVMMFNDAKDDPKAAEFKALTTEAADFINVNKTLVKSPIQVVTPELETLMARLNTYVG